MLKLRQVKRDASADDVAEVGNVAVMLATTQRLSILSRASLWPFLDLSLSTPPMTCGLRREITLRTGGSSSIASRVVNWAVPPLYVFQDSCS